MITVGASSTDRDFASNIMLGDAINITVMSLTLCWSVPPPLLLAFAGNRSTSSSSSAIAIVTAATTTASATSSFHAATSSSSADLHRSANVPKPESLYKIKNPNYKGKWKTPWIDNPEFEDDPHLYVLKPIKYVGIEVWQIEKDAFEEAEKARRAKEEERLLSLSQSLKVVWVPGSFEIGVVAEKLGKSRKYQAILCIGAVFLCMIGTK